MNRKEKIKICTGCESLYNHISSVAGDPLAIINCTMTPTYEGTECPCLKCLVKMRCNILDSDCEEFITYRHNIPVRLL